jgi:SAM-dependent methyltransferase
MKIKKHFSKIFRKFSNRNKEIFTDIFLNNSWNSKESLSGHGSTFEQTRILRGDLALLFEKYQIKSILDIPCGDFNWMKEVDLTSIIYTGADIVKPLIRQNNKLYKSHEKTFKVLDIVNDRLPMFDLVFVRDCFVHLSYYDISIAIKNIKQSKCKYLLTTTFTDRVSNHDTKDGGWRPLNLQLAPFNLPTPIEIINENCTEEGGEYSDKSMALYIISDL